MYDLSGVEGITPDHIEAERKMWLEKITSIATDQRVLKCALLERAAAGLNLDALSVDTKMPTAKHLVERTREITSELIKELE